MHRDPARGAAAPRRTNSNEAAMKLIHMSDIHLTAPGKTIGGRDPRLISSGRSRIS